MSEFRESLRSKGYGELPIDTHRSDIATTISSYLEFLELPDAIHEITKFNLHDRGDGDFGQYTRRAGAIGMRGTVEDNKDIFHFGSMTRQIVEARHRGTMPGVLRIFLDQTEELFWAAERTKLCMIEQLDISSSDLQETMFHETRPINDVLRLLAYYPGRQKLAASHFDRSTMTVAIGESHEGLRIAPGQNGLVLNVDAEYVEQLESSLHPVNHTSGIAKCFLGSGWNRLEPQHKLENEDMPLGWHDVVPSDKTVSEHLMRWSAVLFANPHLGIESYKVPTPPETRPHKQYGRIAL